jgi:hypothetical protein
MTSHHGSSIFTIQVDNNPPPICGCSYRRRFKSRGADGWVARQKRNSIYSFQCHSSGRRLRSISKHAANAQPRKGHLGSLDRKYRSCRILAAEMNELQNWRADHVLITIVHGRKGPSADDCSTVHQPFDSLFYRFHLPESPGRRTAPLIDGIVQDTGSEVPFDTREDSVRTIEARCLRRQRRAAHKAPRLGSYMEDAGRVF